MKRKMLMVFSFFPILLLVPAEVFAADFDIGKADIHALLNKDGTAFVTERYTYEFDGNINGIIRQIAPKDGTAIAGFNAFEGTKQLKVEQYGDLYKIDRTGDDEKINLYLTYTITNAVEKFTDGAQFFWPFFDERNTNAYGNLSITISPPASTQEVDYLGYGEAYGTASVWQDGSVTFTMGDVPARVNGDVRIVYSPELFPTAEPVPGTVKNDLINDRNRLAVQQTAFEKNQQTAIGVSSAALPLAALTLASLFVLAFRRRRLLKKDSIRQETDAFVPDEELSIPAAIYFTKSPFLGPNAISAALIELVRKGLVQQHSEDHYELVSRTTALVHESTLIDLLFDRMGNGTHFQLSDVETYTKNEKNHIPYNDSISNWNEHVFQEVRLKNLYEKRYGMRWLSVGLSALFTFLAIYTGNYELYGQTAFSVFAAMAALVFAIFYTPLTAQGHRIKTQWKRLGKTVKKLQAERWEQLSQDERIRVYAFTLGSNSVPLNKPSAVLALCDNQANQLDHHAFYFNALLLTGVFMAANSITSAEVSGSSFDDGGIQDAGGGSGVF